MKQLFFALLFLMTAQLAFAQAPRKIYQSSKIQYQKVDPSKVQIMIMKPDLVLLDNINLQTASNGARFLYATVKNNGKLAAGGNNMQVRFSWRVDHESFTQVEKFRNFPVPVLNPGQQRTICVFVPDNEIHSNEGFGSSHVSIRFTADSGNIINELLENNNQQYKSLPIIH